MPHIRTLGSDADITSAFPLMSTLRDRIRAETFLAEVRRQQIEGYELVGAFEGARLVALAGVRRSHTLARGEHLFVDDLVTDESLTLPTSIPCWIDVRKYLAKGSGVL
jgi:hypothetical protein